MSEQAERPRRHWLITAVLAVLPVVAAAVLGNLATMPQIGSWYAGLIKPSFNPPNWIFGPVWTLLFAMMAWAFYRILQLPSLTPGRSAAVAFFLIQMALNAAWSWAFFAANSPFAGVLMIACLWLFIAATLVAFWRLDRVAGGLFIPYLAWVSFAAFLNMAIWRLNG